MINNHESTMTVTEVVLWSDHTQHLPHVIHHDVVHLIVLHTHIIHLDGIIHLIASFSLNNDPQ